jgi:chaperonin cofactor prefoldin
MTIKTDNSAVIAKLQAENETLRKEVEQYKSLKQQIDEVLKDRKSPIYLDDVTLPPINLPSIGRAK